jgi:hypothetical protein
MSVVERLALCRVSAPRHVCLSDKRAIAKFAEKYRHIICIDIQPDINFTAGSQSLYHTGPVPVLCNGGSPPIYECPLILKLLPVQ